MNLPPSKDLSRHFRHVPILASAGIEVKGLVPELTTCPFCHHHQFSINMDPLAPGDGKWMHCGSCHFSGDCLELYSKLNKCPDMALAVRRAAAEGHGAIPDLSLLGEDIALYADMYPYTRQAHKRRWLRMTSSLGEHLAPEIMDRLQAEHLWGGWRSGYHERIARFLGAGSRNEIINIMKPTRTILPKEEFKTALALNFQDAPGRICAFMFIGDAGFRMLKTLGRQGEDGGLAMLDSLTPHESTVYAFDDPVFALHVQRKQLADHADPLKLIVYNDETSAAWSSVSADKVILWSRNPDWRVFNHARAVTNGHVSFAPKLGETRENMYDYLRASPLPLVLHRLNEGAEPWPMALCKWLVYKDRPEQESRGAIANLKLTPDERKTIADVCPKSFKDRVLGLLGDSKIYVTKLLNGKPVTEREDGLYVFRPRVGEERITDALVYIEQEICDRDTGKSSVKGRVRFKGVDTPFHVPLDEMQYKYKQWLYGVTTRAGLGTPTLSDPWIRHLPQAAKLFSSPKAVQSVSHVGIQTDGDILFPLFKIVDGQILDSSTVFDSADVPASTLPPPLAREVRISDEKNPSRSCWIAIAAAYVSNLLANERQIPVKPVLLVGPAGSIASIAGRQFARAACMKSIELIAGTRTTAEHGRSMLGKYGYPSFIEVRTPGQLKSYPALNADNVFITTEVVAAAALAIGGDWVQIHAPAVRGDDCMPPISDVFMYLADLQRREYALPDCDTLHESVLQDFCAWYAGYLKADQSETLAEALGMIKAQQPAGDCFLELCYWLYRRGEMSLDRRPFMTEWRENCNVSQSKVGLIIDEDAKQIFICRGRILSGIKRGQLPVPDFASAIADLEKRGVLTDIGQELDGWIVSLEYWNTQAIAWKAKHKPS